MPGSSARFSRPLKLEGWTALVTGASSGIGKVFARQLAAEGVNLILVARSEAKLQTLAAELKKAHGIAAHVFVSDLSFHEAPRRLFESIEKSKLAVDLLINNAGVGRFGYFEDATVEADEAILAVNINALVALTHLFIPGMLVRKKGGILNVASTAGFQPIPFLSLYSATKAFVISFTEALNYEYESRGLRVMTLCPGNTNTDFHRVAAMEKRKIQMVATPEDVVRYGLNVFKNTRRATAVYGFLNKMGTQAIRFVPRSWVTNVTGILFRPQQKPQN